MGSIPTGGSSKHKGLRDHPGPFVYLAAPYPAPYVAKARRERDATETPSRAEPDTLSPNSTPKKSSSRGRLETIAITAALLGVVSIVIGFVVSGNGPSVFSASLEQIIQHRALVNFWFIIGGALIGLAIVGGLIGLGVDAIAEEITARLKRSVTVAPSAPAAPAADSAKS